MRKLRIPIWTLVYILFLNGCAFFEPQIYTETITDTEVIHSESSTVTYKFADEKQNEYEIIANPNVPVLAYNKAAFVLKGGRMSYGEADFNCRFGIDVSYYQEEIDWKKVAADGVEFAMIRLGYRGWSDGVLYMDTRFKENIEGAQSAGIDVGVYFFTQAVNEAEAKEEAEYVLSALEGYEIRMPIACDVEEIDDHDGRMDRLSASRRSRNVAVFCQTIKDAGYEPMIYCNMYYEAYKLNLEMLSAFPIWYADYNRFPQTPYHFDIWQYTCKGKVKGISGNVDCNIQMIKK